MYYQNHKQTFYCLQHFVILPTVCDDCVCVIVCVCVCVCVCVMIVRDDSVCVCVCVCDDCA